jgi:hypothetical protein
VAEHLEGRCLAGNRIIPTPKLIDLAGGLATYDEQQERKQPDWTYQ